MTKKQKKNLKRIIVALAAFIVLVAADKILSAIGGGTGIPKRACFAYPE